MKNLTANGTITVRTFKQFGQSKVFAEKTLRARITAKRASTITGWLVFDIATGKQIATADRRARSGYRHELVAYAIDREGI